MCYNDYDVFIIFSQHALAVIVAPFRVMILLQECKGKNVAICLPIMFTQ
jgi:hypothetical protein